RVRCRLPLPSVGFLQELRKLVDAALVAPAGENGVEKCEDAGLRHVAADQAGAERQDIRIIMLAGELGREWIAHPGTAALGLAVHGDRDGDSAVGIAACNRSSELGAKFRIIDAFRAIRPEIVDLMSLFAKPADKLVL